ncbi:hypothetical protein L0337_08530 [candidate division KSB1 bacterium]|nr:hypothetical protein [candidate division KSB1 bacterium]
MIKSFRILAQTWVNEAFCTLAEGLPSNHNIYCRDGNQFDFVAFASFIVLQANSDNRVLPHNRYTQIT